MLHIPHDTCQALDKIPDPQIFAGNRRQFGLNGVGFGYNPNGLVDRDVPVLRVARPDGSIKAVLFGYACHCTTLGPNYEIGPDWAGFAAQAIESTGLTGSA